MPHKLIVTRPVESGQAFANKVAHLYGDDLDIILSPGLRIDPLDADIPTDITHIIFTSAQGVAQAKRLAVPITAHAWCVGARTAQAAQDLGFQTTVGGGDAAQLIQALLDARPAGQIVHLAGTHTTFDMAAALRAVGLICTEVTAYDQAVCPPTPPLKMALSGVIPLVIPLFSARSGLTLTQVRWSAPIHMVAISKHVAETVVDWGADTVRIAADPSEDAMVELTFATLDQIKRGRSVP